MKMITKSFDLNGWFNNKGIPNHFKGATGAVGTGLRVIDNLIAVEERNW